ncbi:Transcriptional regulator, ArsR family protein [Klebsiella pneumoniae 30660/NJST258_1]|nr:Transcriptional regulator, ArsR family protein [Klebsiella pneumoniae 30684/NJST258_2]AHM84309.1 Transcriptional regulator, ArsR family protein [Klebsiella pneumoniae 30660/NJST258_1]
MLSLRLGRLRRRAWQQSSSLGIVAAGRRYELRPRHRRHRIIMIANHPEREQIRLENVLSALGNPLRLEIIRTLADGSELSCNALRQEEVAKSTMTHHWRVLRDSGVIWQRPQGRENMISLRREDLDARFPGLLDTLLKVMVQAG